MAKTYGSTKGLCLKGKIQISTFQAPILQIRMGAVSYRRRHPTRGAKPRFDRLS